MQWLDGGGVCLHPKGQGSNLTNGVFVVNTDKTKNPIKPKIMKLTYIRKITFNINDTMIHSPLNKNLT